MSQGDLKRREFLKRMYGASALAAGAAVLGVGLYDARGPSAQEMAKALPGLGDYAVKDAKPRMAVVRGADRAAMFTQGMRALGGMEAFITKGDAVLIKVNAAFSSPAALGATTHPELLAAVAQACIKAGAAKVSVTDNPINNPEACFEISGLAAAARQSGAGIVLPSAGLFAPATLPGAKLIKDWPVLAGAFKGAAKLIALAPLKDHARAGASMLLKNMYGLLGGRRNVFHQDINGIIAELALLTRPTLNILDATVSMMMNGPTGGSLSDLKATNTMILSTDPVAADALGVTFLGRTPGDLPYIRMAQQAGAGTADYESLAPIRLDAGA